MKFTGNCKSKKVMRIIKQNLFFAFIYNTIGIPIAAGVLFSVFGLLLLLLLLLLSPMIAALAMSFSLVSVIANADGDGFFYCHILYYMMAGMNRVFSYEDSKPKPYLPNKA